MEAADAPAAAYQRNTRRLERTIGQRARTHVGALDRSDPRLVAQAASGDLHAFDVLVRRHQLPVFRLCLRMLDNRGDAEDAAQDTFLNAWRAIGKFRQEANFSTWLHRLATNRCLRALARRQQPSAELPERAGSLGQPEAEYAALQSLRATTTAMAQLTVEQRVPLLLRQVDGLTYTEIAEVLGVSMTAVKSRLNRARVELARELDDAR